MRLFDSYALETIGWVVAGILLFFVTCHQNRLELFEFKIDDEYNPSVIRHYPELKGAEIITEKREMHFRYKMKFRDCLFENTLFFENQKLVRIESHSEDSFLDWSVIEFWLESTYGKSDENQKGEVRKKTWRDSKSVLRYWFVGADYFPPRYVNLILTRTDLDGRPI